MSNYKRLYGIQPLFAPIAVSASGATAIVEAVAGKKIKVLSYVMVSDGAVKAKFQSNSTDLTGAMSFVANGGVSSPMGAPDAGWLFETGQGEALELNIDSATGVNGHLSYFLEG